MGLNYRPLNIEIKDALVLFVFLDEAQKNRQGIHTDDPGIQLAFWHFLGALEREVIEDPDLDDSDFPVYAEAVKSLRQQAE
jgi:hypothetical protein